MANPAFPRASLPPIAALLGRRLIMAGARWRRIRLVERRFKADLAIRCDLDLVSYMPRGNPSPKLAITIDPDIHEKILAAAARDGVSVSAWMTAAAREALHPW